MPITFDPAKSERNRELRGLPFEMIEEFEWSAAIVGLSKVQNFDPSTRFFAVGRIGPLHYTVIFTLGSKGPHVISLRRSNRKERSTWLANRTRS